MEEIIFPNQIRMHRRLHGMPMQELADHLGVSLSAVSKIEKGYRRLSQEQLIQVAEMLDCSLQDLYVNEQNSQQDVVQAWKREQERRSKINQNAGLKTLGAGLRHIRSDKGLTLMEVAESADMTLSVYHRIEMGQREVSEKEYRNIAKALSMTVDKLKTEIQKLNDAGQLEDIIEHNDTRYKVLNNARYSNMNYSASHETDECLIPLYGNSNVDGNIIIDKHSCLREVACPSNLQNKRGAYAVNLCTRRLGSLLSSRSIMFIDPNEIVSAGDIALYYISENETKLLSIREDENGQLYGLRWNPDERVNLTNSDLTKLHKVVTINL
ncbi:MAG: helix-turn-helix domain-containing protein [Alphaproteobacteria bacterium]|nr:helix-turn-helix domain-containing protein [Alphaproteobacteria bacterium]